MKVFFLLYLNRATKPAKVEDAKAFNDRFAKFNEHGMVLADGGRPGTSILFPNTESAKPTMVLSPGFKISEFDMPASEYERAIEEARVK